LRHFLIVKKTAKEKARSAKKEKAALKKNKSKRQRGAQKKKEKPHQKKQFRSVRILCIPLQSCIVACLN